MAKKDDPLSSFFLPDRKAPLRSGGGAIKAKETPAAFLERLREKKPYSPPTLPIIITVVDGSMELAALYYGVEVQIIEALCKTHRPSREALTKARAAAYARKKDGESVGDVMKKAALDFVAALPDLPTRERWPADEKERAAAIRSWLIDDDALLLYEGNLAKISEAGRIPLHQLVSMVRGDAELQELKDEGDYIAAVRQEARLREIAERSNQPTATIKMLQALGPEHWRDRSTVDVRKVGFDVPADDEAEVGSVLRRVK